MSISLPECVLIVEDEAITRWQIHDILRGMGIAQIHQSEGAFRAKQILERETVDFIFMDINLGLGQDGISLSRELLQNHRLPIVFITAYTDDEIFEETVQLSPYGFLGKPFVQKEVQRTVRIAYGRFLKERALEEKGKENSGIVYMRRGYRYNLTQKKLYKGDQSIFLKGKEAELIDLLCRNAHTVMTYDVLLERLWQQENSLSSLRTVVYTLRKTLPDFPLHNHSKIGYSVETQ